MSNILSRLAALESRPTNKIPKFSVELADGTMRTVHGYELLRCGDDVIKRIHFDESQQTAVDTIALFTALNPGVEVAT